MGSELAQWWSSINDGKLVLRNPQDYRDFDIVNYWLCDRIGKGAKCVRHYTEAQRKKIKVEFNEETEKTLELEEKERKK
jgi:hypothetical protein